MAEPAGTSKLQTLRVKISMSGRMNLTGLYTQSLSKYSWNEVCHASAVSKICRWYGGASL